MRNPVISLAVLTALLLAAPAATAGERYPLRKDLPPLPESLPDDAFAWSGGVEPIPNSASVLGGLVSPYRDTYGDYNVHLGCDQRPHDRWFVEFEFPRRRPLHALRRALREARRKTGEPIEDWLGRRDLIQPVRVGLWSRVHEGERPAGGGKGYLLRHDVELYERSIRFHARSVLKRNYIAIRGAAARGLIRKIQRADSITWTDVETATTSPAMPVSEEMRAAIGRVMDACGISHEPPPATPTAAPGRPALRP
ncbi:MAG: hypothetical protein OXF27_00455 [Acidobacteria bacterium]|nr:hypothetical protein [Acidobacteriota bacterium]